MTIQVHENFNANVQEQSRTLYTMSDDLKIRLINPSEIDALRHYFSDDFFPNEPMAGYMDMESPKDFIPFIDQVSALGVDSGLTMVAENTAEEIVGIRVCLVHTKENRVIFDFPETPDYKRLNLYARGMGLLHEGVDLFDLLKTDKIVMFKGLGVKKAYRRRGLAEKLCHVAIEECKRQGYDSIITESGSSFSRAIFNKFGFTILREIEYATMEIDGKKIMVNEVLAPHTFIASHWLKI